jgi:hypothetical protein
MNGMSFGGLLERRKAKSGDLTRPKREVEVQEAAKENEKENEKRK